MIHPCIGHAIGAHQVVCTPHVAIPPTLASDWTTLLLGAWSGPYYSTYYQPMSIFIFAPFLVLSQVCLHWSGVVFRLVDWLTHLGPEVCCDCSASWGFDERHPFGLYHMPIQIQLGIYFFPYSHRLTVRWLMFSEYNFFHVTVSLLVPRQIYSIIKVQYNFLAESMLQFVNFTE